MVYGRPTTNSINAYTRLHEAGYTSTPFTEQSDVIKNSNVLAADRKGTSADALKVRVSEICYGGFG